MTEQTITEYLLLQKEGQRALVYAKGSTDPFLDYISELNKNNIGFEPITRERYMELLNQQKQKNK